MITDQAISINDLYYQFLFQVYKGAIMALQDIQKELDEVKASVSAETTVGASLVVLLNSLGAMNKKLLVDLDNALKNGADPVAMQAIVDQLNQLQAQSDARTASYSAAVVANTPPVVPQAPSNLSGNQS